MLTDYFLVSLDKSHYLMLTCRLSRRLIGTMDHLCDLLIRRFNVSIIYGVWPRARTKDVNGAVKLVSQCACGKDRRRYYKCFVAYVRVLH